MPGGSAPQSITSAGGWGYPVPAGLAFRVRCSFLPVMHDVLWARVKRKIESLPDAQVYQVLDYIEFLESKYAQPDMERQASGLQRLAEGLEDRLRKRAFNPSNVREAFQLIAAADRALSGVVRAGREILGDFAEGVKNGGSGEPEATAQADPDPEPGEIAARAARGGRGDESSGDS